MPHPRIFHLPSLWLPATQQTFPEQKNRQKIASLLLCLFLISSLMGFTGCKPAEEATTEAKPAAEEEAEAEATEEEEGEETTVKTPAVVEKPPLPSMEVRIPLFNRDTLYGRLYDPGQKAAPPPAEGTEEEDAATEEEATPPRPTHQYPLVLLLHGLNGSYREWGELPEKLVKAGYAVLAVDLRGHGQSALRGRTWRNFQEADWAKMVSDVGLVLNFFPNLESYPQVDKTSTVLVGASLGANVAILSASKHPEIKGIIALSPGVDYKGLDAVKPLFRFKNPILMVASQNDLVSYEDTQILYRLPPGQKDLQLYKNVGHGTDMIRFYPELQDKVVDWVRGVLPPIAKPIQYPVEAEEAEEEA